MKKPLSKKTASLVVDRTTVGELEAHESIVVLTLSHHGTTAADEWDREKLEALMHGLRATVALDRRFPRVMVARLETGSLSVPDERAAILKALGPFDRFICRRAQLGDELPFGIYDDHGQNDPQVVLDRHLASKEGRPAQTSAARRAPERSGARRAPSEPEDYWFNRT